MDYNRILEWVRPVVWALVGFEFLSLVLITAGVKAVALVGAESFWDNQGRVRVWHSINFYI